MVMLMLDDAATLMSINGIVWSWRGVDVNDVDRLLPLVMAADPSGLEAACWRREVHSWLGGEGMTGGMSRGITSVECLAGLTLGLFFYSWLAAPSTRRLVVERLRWLELARPHRSLDAVLAIVVAHGQQRICQEILMLDTVANEQNARQALSERARCAGFQPAPNGWSRRL